MGRNNNFSPTKRHDFEENLNTLYKCIGNINTIEELSKKLVSSKGNSRSLNLLSELREVFKNNSTTAVTYKDTTTAVPGVNDLNQNDLKNIVNIYNKLFEQCGKISPEIDQYKDTDEKKVNIIKQYISFLKVIREDAEVIISCIEKNKFKFEMASKPLLDLIDKIDGKTVGFDEENNRITTLKKRIRSNSSVMFQQIKKINVTEETEETRVRSNKSAIFQEIDTAAVTASPNKYDSKISSEARRKRQEFIDKKEELKKFLNNSIKDLKSLSKTASDIVDIKQKKQWLMSELNQDFLKSPQLLKLLDKCEESLREAELHAEICTDMPKVDRTLDFEEDKILEIDTAWFNSDEINKLLQHFLGGNDNVRLMVSINSSQGGGAVLSDNFDEVQFQDVLLCSLSAELVKNTIIAPININNNHWVALCIRFNTEDRTAPEIKYFDPKGQPMNSNIKKALKKAYPGLTEEKFLECPIKFQYDGHNCGPWTVAILTSLVNNQALPDEGFDINLARANYRAILADYNKEKERSPSPPLLFSAQNEKSLDLSNKMIDPVVVPEDITEIKDSCLEMEEFYKMMQNQVQDDLDEVKEEIDEAIKNFYETMQNQVQDDFAEIEEEIAGAIETLNNHQKLNYFPKLTF